MQQKNLILFIALCLLILFGWPMLMNQFMGKPRQKQGEKTAPNSTPVTTGELAARLSGVPSSSPPAASDIALAIAGARDASLRSQPNPALIWKKLPPAQQESLRILSGALAAWAPRLNGSGAFDLSVTRPVARTAPARKVETYAIGGGPEDYLTGTLTTRGAGLQELLLNKFEAATHEGRPSGRTLALIQNDPVKASFLMFHYPDPDKPDVRPLDTLGTAIWDYKGGDSSKRVFSTTLGDFVITKTFSLAPRTYHLTLKLEIEYKGQPGAKAPAKFRYQLVGPHGIPIEGEWYTSTYRHPMICSVDSRGSAIREDVELGETQHRISFQHGGHRIPEGTDFGARNHFQYAGVASQFFASLIVADDKQPADWTDFKQIVNFVRPTLESEERRGILLRVDGDQIVMAPRMEAWELRGTINSISKNELVLTAPGKQDQLIRFKLDPLLPRVHEVINAEGFKTGSEVIVSFDTRGEERIAYDLRGANADFTFHMLPRVRERLEQEQLEKAREVRVVVNGYRSFDGRLIATDIRKGESLRPFAEDITVRAMSEVKLDPGKKAVHQFMLYNGPVKVRLLSQFSGDQAVDPSLVTRYADDLHLSTLTDYRSAGPFGWFAQKIFWTDLLIWCTNLMHRLLFVLNFVVSLVLPRSWGFGVSIVLLTVLVRGLMFPISRRQAYLSIKMQELAPEVKKVSEKYKGDQRARNEAVMELYRRHHVNPMGGCLPLFLQMPVFLGLYYALQESIHFRLAPFLWIQNLAAPDMLFRWGEIPIIGNPDNLGAIYYLGPFFNLLPVIAVGFMIVQQKMLTPPPQDEQQAFQQKLMKYMMIFFGVMFYKVAAGLCLYFIVSSLWGVTERKLLPKKPTLAPAGGAPPPKKADSRRPVSSGVSSSPAARARAKGGRKEKTVTVDGPMQRIKDWWAELLKQARKK
jgi:YidC/Oxa1 family membrane protein insertase